MLLKNNRLLKCFVHGNPPTATSQQKNVRVLHREKIVKGQKTMQHVPIFFDPAHVEKAKQMLAAQFAKYRPGMKYQGPVYLRLLFLFQHPGSHKKALRETTIAKHTRPDLDNLQKLFIDAISPLFFEDDNQVAEITAGKYWSPTPGISLEIWQ